MSPLPEIAAAAPFLPGQTTSVKYDPKQPTNSILACEAWCGIPDLEPNRNRLTRARGRLRRTLRGKNLINGPVKGGKTFLVSRCRGRYCPSAWSRIPLPSKPARQGSHSQVVTGGSRKRSRTESRLQSEGCESRVPARAEGEWRPHWRGHAEACQCASRRQGAKSILDFGFPIVD